MSSSATGNTNNKGHTMVPFFVLNLEGDKSKVLFTVPSHLAESLLQHSILCRGAAFALTMDTTSNDSSGSSSSSSSCFVSTEFTSPNPEATAEAIAARLASRISDACENPLGSILGF